MITIFLIAGFILGLVLLSGAKSTGGMAVKRCDTNPDDRKHSWVVRFSNEDRKGYLVCKVCNKVPGDD